jgi:hypothetical protein
MSSERNKMSRSRELLADRELVSPRRFETSECQQEMSQLENPHFFHGSWPDA